MQFALIVILISFGIHDSLAAAAATKPRNPLLLISLDGFQAAKFNEFIHKHPESNFSSFIRGGLKAEYMKPSFPSLTFPNHWTIVTGLYPQNTGIVGNSFYDPSRNMKINLLSNKEKLDVYWWNKTDPIWLTAKQQGLKTGCSFWPGSEVWPRNPDMYYPFNSQWDWKERMDQMVSWLSKFNLDFATFYFDEPDHEGHLHGPDSIEYSNMLARMDAEIGYFMNAIKSVDLYEKLNIIILSDHGMAAVKEHIKLSDYLDITKLEKHSLYGIVSHIYPVSKDLHQEVFTNISRMPHVNVYFKEDIPKEFHYSNSDRIGPIVIIADEGYSVDKDSTSDWYIPGNHGYNNSAEPMRTIFMARGPDFPRNKKTDNFENVNVYPLMCRLLQIECHDNDGQREVVDRLLNDSNKIRHITWILISPVILLLYLFR